MAKIMIVGASNVGKTSLINRLVFRDFSNVSPTIGVNFAQKVCMGDAGPVSLSIWDLSGHPRFLCLMPRFCNGATGVMIVFDLTNPDSLEEGAKWMHRISSYIGSPKQYAVVLVGNKADLTPRISTSEIQTFCNLHHISDYIRCSSKSGENVKLAFEALCSAMQRDVSVLLDFKDKISCDERVM
jgi:small GTP-binding protein